MYTGICAHKLRGFTLIEILVVAAIIALLASVVLFSTDQARKQSRDRKRMAELKQLQLAIELYAQEHGEYPAAGCNGNGWAGPDTGGSYSCTGDYIVGLVPEYLQQLPIDEQAGPNEGFLYRTNTASGRHTEFKMLVNQSVESLDVPSKDADFARYPIDCPSPGATTHIPNSYAVYSEGARCW